MSRKRWEYREQAIAHFAVQGEAMGASKETKRTTAAPQAGLFRENSGGINQGPPPLAELRKLGLDIEM